MTDKEKARAYDEAVEKARQTLEASSAPEAKTIVYHFFPELAESEDERILRIIKRQMCQDAVAPTDEERAMVDAWLEKQKEQKPKQEPKWLYRLEFKDKSCGLWYNGKGEWCFESGIGSLDDSCKTKTLPMDYDERYKADGRDWFSSCSRKEDLLHWYSKEDARILLRKGFVFTKYLATEYTEYEQQTVFIKETALYREEIDFFSLFNEQKPAEDNPFTPLEGIDAIKAKYYDDGFKNGFDEGVDSVAPVEWSEEDELTIADLINYFEGDSLECSTEEMVQRIKSLRPSWKPSEEQMEALRETIDFAPDTFKPKCTLESLYEQLKRLKDGILV